jgi:maltose/moltooligosaccharide transporter
LLIAIGAAIALMTAITGLRRELYLIAGLGLVLGGGQWATAWSARHGRRPTGLLEIIDDVLHMPPVLRRLAVVQFFTWFGLFAMWIYIVPAVASHSGGGTDPASFAYNRSADWVGVMFALYNVVAAAGALLIPGLAKRLGRRETYCLCLAFGSAGLFGFAFIGPLDLLWIPAAAIGIAWAAILSIPYAMVASAVPPSRMGVYMGIHNVFLVLPQLVAAALLGWIVSFLFGGRPELALILAAGMFLVAALVSLTIPDRQSN